MERETRPSTPKLVDVVARDFPDASKVRVSFPEQWEHVETVQTLASPLYIAGFPIERAFMGREHFEGLSPEINVNLVFYRLYKFFEPWPLPQVSVEWNASHHRGRVTDSHSGHLQLQPVGQAQAWFGVECAVLWECYLDLSRKEVNTRHNLEEVWHRIEQDLGATKFFTLPHEPAFEGNYTEFLGRLGYKEDTENFGWWSKHREQRRDTITPPGESS